jgi:hypothetical protein
MRQLPPPKDVPRFSEVGSIGSMQVDDLGLPKNSYPPNHADCSPYFKGDELHRESPFT